MQIPTFREIIGRLTRQATVRALRADIPAGDAALRFNVVVRPETRAFLDAQALALGSSLAALSGNILDSVAAVECETVGYSRELLTSRFYLLLKEHGLSLPAAAEVLRSLGITAGDMADQKLLLEKLDTKTLEWLANHFHVAYEWLAGQSEWPVRQRMGSWYKSQTYAAHRMVDLARSGASVEFIIARKASNIDFAEPESKDENSPREDALQFIPLIRVRHQAGASETYETFEVWEGGRWNYWRSRQHIKMVIYFATKIRGLRGGRVFVSGISLPQREFSALVDGAVLVPSLVRRHGSTPWHPDDFVEPWSAAAKDKSEWASILNHPDYKSDFAAVEELLSAEMNSFTVPA